ncbi:hypothetical protein Desti_1450 [Desulfomonile tiedjei DSM 6799]|uniref:L,D-TPase catalytic domain-containing protein n=2 Tax=Desulfomonile tiedjei TaxID=2358 RepID=I4C3M1_DESTA|nr:hypothetical protein Desti_1450 [Desulfomonile tiedjei DSM 6799]
MLAPKLKNSRTRGSLMQAKKNIPLVVLVVACLWTGVCGAEPLYPAALMNWMVEGTFHVLIVDKSQQRLGVWQIKDGEPLLLESYRCSTGENEGDKWVRGDMRTPEGVYFFCSVIDGRALPSKYGFWAFTTDYPNFVDRRRGKNGDGIWLHGRDKPLAEKPDSNGCVALENQDLAKVSRFVRLQSTPLIVVNQLVMAPRTTIIHQERQLRSFIESWRKSWESKDLDEYMAHYSPNFQSAWLDHKGWKEKKRKLNSRYSKIKVKLGNIYLYRQDGIITSIFTQSYSSDGFRSTGIKVLYIVPTGDRFSIYTEDYHQPVDDPFPVAPLLARIGVDAPTVASSEKSDFRIRLVSTDEPLQDQQGELETPRPSAPSRGVVLDRIAGKNVKDFAVPETETNARVGGPGCVPRLMVQRESSAPIAETANITMAKRVIVNEGPTEPIAQLHTEGTISAGLTAATRGPVAVVSKPETKWSESKAAGDGSSSARLQQNENVVQEFLNKWKSAWEQKNLDRYMKMYHPEFEQTGMDYAGLLKSKKSFFRKYKTIRVEIDRVEIRKENGRTHVKFVQTFQGDSYRDKGWKNMVLADDKDKKLRIVSEGWTALSESASDSGSKTSN